MNVYVFFWASHSIKSLSEVIQTLILTNKKPLPIFKRFISNNFINYLNYLKSFLGLSRNVSLPDLASTRTIPFLSLWYEMFSARAADCVARTSLHGARFRLMEVTETRRKEPSSNGPSFRRMPSVMIPWVTRPEKHKFIQVWFVRIPNV